MPNDLCVMRQEFMGRIAMTLTRVMHDGEFKDEFQLGDVKSGKLVLRLKWKSLS